MFMHGDVTFACTGRVRELVAPGGDHQSKFYLYLIWNFTFKE